MNSNESDKYDIFWTHCQSYLDDCTAVHKRRHDTVTYMAKAISVRDLVEQVARRCPEGTPILSQQGVRLPKNP